MRKLVAQVDNRKVEKRKEELVVGIGSSMNKEGKLVLGIAQIFHSDGRYLVGDCSPLSLLKTTLKI